MVRSDFQSEKRRALRETGIAVAALFTSTGTLVCCALPILLVSIAGLGSVVASLTNNFPLLITLSQHKGWVLASGCWGRIGNRDCLGEVRIVL